MRQVPVKPGQRWVVSGIDTDSGKTVVSALLCNGLKADYWKPVQAGEPTDSDWIAQHTDSSHTTVFPETYKFALPASPHRAAEAEGICIDPSHFQIPQTTSSLIIEGAGGLMVPINREMLLIDLFAQWKIPLILVVKTYLGCINHALLSVEAIRNRNIPLAGIVFNEGGRPESEEIILQKAQTTCIGKIPVLENLSRDRLIEVFRENFSLLR